MTERRQNASLKDIAPPRRSLKEEVKLRTGLSGEDFLRHLGEEYRMTGPESLIFYPNVLLAEFSAQCIESGGLEKYREKYPHSAPPYTPPQSTAFAIQRLDSFVKFIQGSNEEEIEVEARLSRQAIDKRLKKVLRDLYEDAPPDTKARFNQDEILGVRQTRTQQAIAFLRAGFTIDEIGELFGGLSSQLITNIRKGLQDEGDRELSEKTYHENHQTHFRRMKTLDELRQTTDFEVLKEGISEFSDSFCRKLRKGGDPFFVPLRKLIPEVNNFNVNEAALLLEDNGYPVRIIERRTNGARPQMLRYYYVPTPVLKTARLLLHQYFS